MLLWLALLNVVLSIMNGVNGIEDQSLFSIWVSGYCTATAYALLIMWLFKDKEEH